MVYILSDEAYIFQTPTLTQAERERRINAFLRYLSFLKNIPQQCPGLALVRSEYCTIDGRIKLRRSTNVKQVSAPHKDGVPQFYTAGDSLSSLVCTTHWSLIQMKVLPVYMQWSTIKNKKAFILKLSKHAFEFKMHLTA